MISYKHDSVTDEEAQNSTNLLSLVNHRDVSRIRATLKPPT